MPPDRMPPPDIATDLFWDAFAKAEFADTIAVEPADVATIRYLHTRAAWPDPSPEFAERLRTALLTIGATEAAAPDNDDLPLSVTNDRARLPLLMPVVAPFDDRRRRWPLLAAAAVLALLLTGLAVWQFANDNDPPASIPAVAPAIGTTTASDVSTTPVMPQLELPAASVPWAAFGVTFDHRSMPPMSESEDANDDSLKLRYLLFGTVSASSDGHLRVLRGSGDGVWEETIPGSLVMLEAGDAIFVDDGAPIAFVNSETAPAEFIAWSLFPEGGGNSETPPGWDLHAQNAWHIISLAPPDAPVLLRLERVELAPSASLTPPAGALVDQIVYLPRNAAGELVAPMLGNLPEGGTRNMGRQELTVYRLIIKPLNGEGREGS